jgi:hypothetical protein
MASLDWADMRYTSTVCPVGSERYDKSRIGSARSVQDELIRCGPPPRESPETGTRSAVDQPFNFEGPVCSMKARVLRVLHRTRRRGSTNRRQNFKPKNCTLQPRLYAAHGDPVVPYPFSWTRNRVGQPPGYLLN